MSIRVRVRALCLVLVALFMSVFFVRVAAGGERGTDYVLLIDCTGTMRYAGRGDATVEAVGDFIAATCPGDCISVFGYGEEPGPLVARCPVTVGDDMSAEQLVSGIAYPFEADRTDITRGLDLVWEQRERLFPKRYGAGNGDAFVVLLTDGKLIPMYDDYAEYDEIYGRSRRRLLELAGLFREENIPVWTVCLGAAEKVEVDLMSRLAELSGGRCWHVPASSGLSSAFVEIESTLVRASSPEEVVAETPSDPEGIDAFGDVSLEDDGAVNVVAPGAEEAADGIRERPRGGQNPDGRVEGSLAARYANEDLEELIYQSIVGILGVAIGFVAIGIHRHESWARAFTKPLLKKEIRVRGYLKPVTPSDVMSARAAIPIENPGLPAIQVGEGMEQGAWLNGVLVEFIGTTDDSPPSIRVHKGDVSVEDQPVEEERRLQDGDRIQLGDECYCYLRGTRR